MPTSSRLTSSRLTPSRLTGVDGLRALACLMVMAHHAFQRLAPQEFFPGFKDLQLFFITGHMGVSVFFVLSGYLLSQPFWRAYAEERELPSLNIYARRRMARIAPAFWLNLCLTFVLALDLVPDATNRLVRFLAGLTFTSGLSWQTLFPVDLNAPLWSIGLEVTSYLLMPLVMIALFRLPGKRSLPKALAFWCGALVAALAAHALFQKLWPTDSFRKGIEYGWVGLAKHWWPQYNPFGFFSQYSLGILAAGAGALLRSRNNAEKPSQRWLFDALAAATILVLAGTLFALRSAKDFEFSLQGQPYFFPTFPGLVALLLVVLPFTRAVGRLLDNAFFRFLSTISYGLYLWHFLFLELVRLLWAPEFAVKADTSFVHWLVATSVAFLAAGIVATLSWYWFEEPIVRWSQAEPGARKRRLATARAGQTTLSAWMAQALAWARSKSGPTSSEQGQSKRKRILLRVTASALLLTGAPLIYKSVQLAVLEPGTITILYAFVTCCIVPFLFLHAYNQLSPKDSHVPALAPADLAEVAAVVPTCGEPLDVLRATLQALTQLDYPRDKLHLFIGDDGRRPEVARLAEELGFEYVAGPRKDAKAGNLNVCLARIRALHPNCDLILTQDADELADQQLLMKIVGSFQDPRVAFVQTPKDSIVPPGDPFGNRDRFFYDVVQPGRNGANAAFACGSGVVWRISALDTIGGFSTWNLVEDLTTSYALHNRGFRSAYVNEVLTVGLAPEDIPGLLKQRGTWATDSLRMFLFDNPLWKRGKLTWAQRLQYLEIGLFYVISAFAQPAAFALPVISLLTGDFPDIDYTLYRLSLLTAGFGVLYAAVMAEGNLLYVWRCWQYSVVGHAPLYLKALWTALRSRNRKPRYVVTRKTRLDGFHGGLLWPQYAAVALGIAAVIIGVDRYYRDSPEAVILNAAAVIYFVLMLAGIIRASLYGVLWKPSEGGLQVEGSSVLALESAELSVIRAERD